jgi:hypothetical protein
MGRGPRSRATRAERRMQKERAASALAHGLPVPTPPPARSRGGDAFSSRPPSSAPPLSGQARPSGALGNRLSLPVKLLGVGLGLLGALYGLTLLRDHKDAVPTHFTPESQAALVVPSPARVASPSPSASSSAALLAARVKAATEAINARKLFSAPASSSAGQPNAAAALLPPEPTVK